VTKTDARFVQLPRRGFGRNGISMKSKLPGVAASVIAVIFAQWLLTIGEMLDGYGIRGIRLDRAQLFTPLSGFQVPCSLRTYTIWPM
jgi:hypothetical protein